ncbi:MAG: LysM peptidoglycan-binding domain-containing protein, partial [Muribaculaceae bacterium]|nr:LysM peptidoglycan-binding domain-containing protein [Muribaculaceae bacterium]
LPMFIAANYVMTYYPQHNINPVIPKKPIVTDTVGVCERVHFDQIAAVLGLPKDELKILNPQYREDVIPGSPERPYMLTLPSRQIQAYLMSHDQILAYKAEQYRRRTNVQPAAASVASQDMASNSEAAASGQDLPSASADPTSVSHKVAAGETLTSIAAKYGVQPAEIRSANNLRRNAVRVGQVLTINNVAPEIASAARKAADANMAAAANAKEMKTNEEALAQSQTQSQPKKETVTKPAATKSSTAGKATANKTTAKGSGSKTTSKSTARKATTHKIQSGENLGRIARKYGVTVDAIKKANGMKSDAIRAGAELKIPAKK